MNYYVEMDVLKFFDLSFEELKKKAFYKTDLQHDFQDAIKINNILYSSGCMLENADKTDKVFKVEKFKFTEKPDGDWSNEIKCPFCGTEKSDSWDYSDEDDHIQCDSCKSIFSYSREVEVSYRCEPVEKNEKIVNLAS